MASRGGASIGGFGAYAPNVTGGGGGGPSPGGTISWGPLFGGSKSYSNGIRVATDLQSLGLSGGHGIQTTTELTKYGVGYNLAAMQVTTDFSSLALEYVEFGIDVDTDFTQLRQDWPDTHEMQVANDLNALALAGGHGVQIAHDGEATGAPFVVSTTNKTASGVGISPITVDKPSGTEEGDLLLCFVGVKNASGNPITWTIPTGWTEEIIENGATFIGGGVFYKIATATEPGAYSFGWNSTVTDLATATMFRLIGIDSTTPINASAADYRSQTGDLETDPTIPSVTTTVDNCMVFAVVAPHDHNNLSQTHVTLANHVEHHDFEASSLTATIAQITNTRVYGTAGATGTIVLDCSQSVASSAVCFRVAVAPGPVDLVP